MEETEPKESPSLPDRFRTSKERYGTLITVKAVLKHLIRKVYTDNLIHKQSCASLGSIYRYTQFHLDVNSFLESVCNINYEKLADYKKEFQLLTAKLESRYINSKLSFPLDFGINMGSSFSLYVLTRHYKPEKIVETGVANGVSTFFFLNALVKNNSGTLISLDITNKVAVLLAKEEQFNWELRIIKPTKESFREAIRATGVCDFFLHDSDHSYAWQMHEYTTLLPFIREGGLMLSDDVDSSFAFVDFVNRNSLHQNSFTLFDGGKIFGAIKV